MMKNDRTVGWTVLGLGLMAMLLPAAMAQDASVEGFWKGSIFVPGQELEVMIDFAKGDEWTAIVFVPSQGIRDVKMTGVSVEDGSVRMAIPGVPGEPTFKGQLAEDGRQISGEFSQGGTNLEFTLTRAEKPAELSVDVYAEYNNPGLPGEGMAGTWRALIKVGPHRMRLVLSISADESGKLSGRLHSLDQNNTEVDLDSVSLSGNAVAVEILQIGARFEGTLDEKQSEIKGTWKQGGGDMPLTFRRAAS